MTGHAGLVDTGNRWMPAAQNCSMPAPPDPPPPSRPARGKAKPTGQAGQVGEAGQDRDARREAPAPLSGPARALRKLGLLRDIDLALHLPLRYEDETCLVPIATLRDGDSAQVQGLVRESRVETHPRHQLVVRLADASGELVLRFLHFYPAQQKQLAPGRLLRVRGEVRGGFLGREMVHPVVRAVEPSTPLPAALTPVYPTNAQLPQAYLRKAIASALARAPLDEIVPPALLPAGLPTLAAALQALHHPAPGQPLAELENRSHPAWRRLKFDELLAQQLAQAQARAARAALRAPVLARAPAEAGAAPVHPWLQGAQPDAAPTAALPHERPTAAPPPAGPTAATLHARLLAALPFALTAAQRRVVAEIEADLGRERPMHRLLQGDVGSGKTVVAALAAARAVDAGWQCALMAPTEILAEQHFRRLVEWLEPIGVPVAWLTGSRKGRARRTMLDAVASGAAPLVVGTHAVIQQDVAFAGLGLAVVDEQHRFGVAQRLALRAKLAAKDLEPHLLMMSATPIPRTLAMSYFADLDVSTIDELPPGRTQVATRLFGEERRAQVVARIRDELAAHPGRQVYWVCPLIEESAQLDLQNATATHAELSAALPGTMVGLLHGRMPAAEKAAVMSLFAGGTMRVLVATTVIEVGVDVPSASLMVIEHAERFGLAQLHQLRGRVGRGATASVCVLLYARALSAAAKERLRAMSETTDGFEISRRDLGLRGPGEFLGARQSGDALLRFADLEADSDLLHAARTLAPRLLAEHPQAAARHVARWLGERLDYVNA
jgi:ATP-dependent DNA helicase RecG